MLLALLAGINDDDIFLRMQDLLAEAMAEGLSVHGALNALSLSAVRLYLRNDIGNPFVRATASDFLSKWAVLSDKARARMLSAKGRC